jgi:RNA polymerase sigma-70 factor (ECF subfamily)
LSGAAMSRPGEGAFFSPAAGQRYRQNDHGLILSQRIPMDVSNEIQDLLKTATAAWPDVALAAETFAAHLARLEAEDARTPTDRLAHAADLYLACACAEHNPRALRAFEDHFLSKVGDFVARTDASPAFAAEVRHQLRDRLLIAEPGSVPRIGRYSGRGPLGGWVRMAAVRLALDLKRAAQPVAATDRLPDVGDTNNPEMQMLKRRYASEYQRALYEAWQGLAVRERTLLRLHFIDGRNVDEIGKVYQVHRATAARWIVAARERVLDSMIRILATRVKLTKAEFNSIANLVGRELHISLSSIAG